MYGHMNVKQYLISWIARTWSDSNTNDAHFVCRVQGTYTLQSLFHRMFWISRITIFGNEQK
jgi:hypothetical protein